MDEDLEIYNNRGPNGFRMQLVYIITGFISLPVTFTVLFAALKLLKKRVTIDLKISLFVLIADFITSMCLIFVGLMARFNGLYIVYHKWYCGFTIILFGNVAYLSIYYVGLMSLERGLLIIHNIKLPEFFWLSLMIGEMIYFSLLTIIAASSGQLGLVDLAYACMVTPNFELEVVLTYSYLALLTWNFVCMLYCYIGIAVKLRLNAWKNIRELHSNKETTLRQANRTIVKVLSLLCIYILSNGFELFNFITESITGVTRPGIYDLISSTLVLLGPIVNSIILVQFHDSVKLSLLETLPFLNAVFNLDPSTSLNHSQFNTAINEGNEQV